MSIYRCFYISILVIFSSISYAEIDFQLLPSKAIKPGDVAIQVLPVKSIEKTELFITKKSSLGFAVEGPSEVSLEPNQMQYLTFITTVPTRARAGLLHKLEIQFVNKKTNKITTQILTFAIALNQNLDFFVPDQDLTSYTRTKIIPLRISNTGNAEETYEVEVENFTPSAEITLSSNKLKIAAQESKLLQINLRFSNKTSHISFFEIKAKLNGITKFKKRFKVRFIFNEDSQNQNGGHNLDTQMVISNDFISIDGNNSHLSSVIYSANGSLSDYVSLSAYIQAQMIDGKDRDIADMRFDFNGDNWYVNLGSDVSLSPTQSVIGTQIGGLSTGYDFENGFQVGTMIGINEENGDVHTAATASYDLTPNQRLFLLVDQNTTNQKTSSAAGYDGRFQINQKLSFAPSLIVSDTHEQGTRINYRQTLKYIVRDNFPIIIDSGFNKNQDTETLFADLETSYVYRNIVFRLGGRVEGMKEINNLTSDTRNQNSQELFASMAVPIGSNINGQIQFRYLGTEEAKEYRPEIAIQYSEGKLIAQIKSALVNRELKEKSFNQTPIDWEPVVEIDLSYKFEKILVQGRAYYESLSENESRHGAEFSMLYYLNNKWLNNIFVKVGAYQDEFVEDEIVSRHLQVGSTLYHTETATFEVQATIEDRDEIEEPEYFVGARLTLKDQIKVPRRIQDLFGGNRTGSINGKICIDNNENNECEDGELTIPNLRVKIEGIYVHSDEYGEFNLSNIEPGEIKIEVEKQDLSAKNLASLSLNKMVTISKNQEARVDFSVFAISSIKAFTFFDRNGDGIFDSDLENEIDNVRIVLSGDNFFKKQISNGPGSISFDRIQNGTYTLEAISPGEEYFATTPKKVNLSLPSQTNQTNQTILFGFAIKQSDLPPQTCPT